MNRSVIVTGGCGYIGSHVARAFKQQGYRVTIVDQVFREHTVKGIDGYLIADFASEESLSLIVNGSPDVIVHCAGTSLVGPSMTDPGEYYQNNVAKTIQMLNVIRHMDKKPVIMFSSSASVYGEPEELPITEESLVQPISPYGNSKAITEVMLRDYFRAHGLNSICFRYFNAAGAEPNNFDLGQEPNATHLIARALEASIAGREMEIYGNNYTTTDGTCVRDYIHVWDLAAAHIAAADYFLDDYPQTGALIVNLGTNTGTSNLEIAKYIGNKYGLDYRFVDNRSGDPAALVASGALAFNTLGWVPHYSNIETIVDSAYKWYTRTK